MLPETNDEVKEIKEALASESPADLAAFCVQKIAKLEARFIILCHRVHAAGIECAGLCDNFPPQDSAPSPALKVMN